MITKTFKASSYSEALVVIKREMGVKVEIDSFKYTAPRRGVLGAFSNLLGIKQGGVEVTAKVDERYLNQEQLERLLPGNDNKETTETFGEGDQRDISLRLSETAQKRILLAKLEGLDAENKKLRAQLAHRSQENPVALPPGVIEPLPFGEKGLLWLLAQQQVGACLQKRWREKLTDLPQNTSAEEIVDACAGFFMSLFRAPALPLPRVMALTGPSGSGKTTTALKLAARWRSQNQSVVFVSRVAQDVRYDWVKKECAGIGVDFVAGDQAKDLGGVLAQRSDTDHVLIDTGSLSPRDVGGISLLAEALTVTDIGVFATLSATAGDMERVIRAYAPLLLKGLIFTRIDEALSVGPLFDLLAVCPLPVVFFGIGSGLKEDLEDATVERLLSIFLAISEKSGR